MRAAELGRGGIAAVSFLTRLPVGRAILLDGGDLARGAAFFPLVGAGIGAAVGGIAAGLAHIVSPLVAAGLAVCAGTLLTGALHLDALADTADALTAGRARALEIMRDHAIGAYGAAALSLDLIVKTAALAGLTAQRQALWAAIAACSLSRAAPVALGALLPTLRTDGAGAAFRVSRVAAGAAVAIAAMVAVAAGRLHGLELGGIASIGVVLLGVFFLRWLGGVTGDLLGSAAELTETLALVAAAALVGAR
ncbi:MAG TPA: adenosylcobinamide-GDP ribazoletransferase [Gaiellaceae bacterium]